MAVIKEVPGRGWYSEACGQWHSSEEAALHYERLELQRRSKPADILLDPVPTDELRTHIAGRLADAAVREALEASHVPAAVFLKLNPWFEDCEVNTQAMFVELWHLMNERKLVPPINYDDWLRVASDLRGQGVLVVNEAAEREQQEAQLEKEIRSRPTPPTLEELEQLPSGWFDRPGLR